MKGLSPFDELDELDHCVECAGNDEDKTMFDDDTHPKPPHPKEEAITDELGKRSVDIMVETPPIGEEVEFDLTEREIRDADLF